MRMFYFLLHLPSVGECLPTKWHTHTYTQSEIWQIKMTFAIINLLLHCLTNPGLGCKGKKQRSLQDFQGLTSLLPVAAGMSRSMGSPSPLPLVPAVLLSPLCPGYLSSLPSIAWDTSATFPP